MRQGLKVAVRIRLAESAERAAGCFAGSVLLADLLERVIVERERKGGSRC